MRRPERGPGERRMVALTPMTPPPNLQPPGDDTGAPDDWPIDDDGRPLDAGELRESLLEAMAERWQRREREVDAHVANGDVVVHGDGDALLEHLDQLDTSSCDEQP